MIFKINFVIQYCLKVLADLDPCGYYLIVYLIIIVKRIKNIYHCIVKRKCNLLC